MNVSSRGRVALAVAVLAVGSAACPGNIHHSYRGFQSAVDRGASCSELFDQRGRFSRTEDLVRIDADLARIGCASRDSVRTGS
jgi:coenzyme F420-reducing hydrogenase gamma subunit